MKLFQFVIAAAWIGGAASAEVSVERGEYLVRGPMGCGNCHTPLGPTGPILEEELAGRLVDQNEMMTAYGANLTPAGHIADWTDEELARAIREGIRPDGTVIGPPMPIVQYRHIADDDLASIMAFLRTLPAVENEIPESTYNIPLPPAYGPPVESVAATEPGVTEVYGSYLGDHRALHGMPLADGTAGPDVRPRRRAHGTGRDGIRRTLGHLGRAEHHLQRGRARRLHATTS